MLGRKRTQGFQFDYDASEAHEVWNVYLSKPGAFLVEREWWLSHEWNTALGELESQALLIDRLKKARAHCAIHLEDSSLDAKHLIRLQ